MEQHNDVPSETAIFRKRITSFKLPENSSSKKYIKKNNTYYTKFLKTDFLWNIDYFKKIKRRPFK